MSYLKLGELWNECEKLDAEMFGVFVRGLDEIHKKKFASKPAKPCVAKQKVLRDSSWSLAEEDLLHKYCNGAESIAKGVTQFLQETDSERTAKACEVRVGVMKREGRW